GKKPEATFCLNWQTLLGEQFVQQHDRLEAVDRKNAHQVKVATPPASSLAAWQRLVAVRTKLPDYAELRDLPAEAATSQLSIYLKAGLITSAQVIATLGLSHLSFEKENGPTRFLKELVWREFYYAILYHCPRVEQEPFIQKYKHLPWENNPS